MGLGVTRQRLLNLRQIKKGCKSDAVSTQARKEEGLSRRLPVESCLRVCVRMCALFICGFFFYRFGPAYLPQFHLWPAWATDEKSSGDFLSAIMRILSMIK